MSTRSETFEPATQPAPGVGRVPETMQAAVIRPDRFGDPRQAIQLEEVPVPELKPGYVLVYVMAAGMNYNNIWACRSQPVDVIAQRRKREPDSPNFHIGGTEGSGIVWAVGDGVTRVKVGDHVVLSGAQWDPSSSDVVFGEDPLYSRTTLAWGYESNFGTFAQFALAAEYQCLEKPRRLGWAEAASVMLTGPTAYRQLTGWPPHVVEPGDPVLIWGGAGGLGSMACQIVNLMGGRAVAVVSTPERAEFCRELGAVGTINRRDFDHWGPMPAEPEAKASWTAGMRAFGAAFWEALGERRSPRIVFEHSGGDTLPTSVFLCDTGGMVVTCGATSGYLGAVDLRYLWMRQKRLQGSHYGNPRECRKLLDLFDTGHMRACVGAVYDFEQIAEAHHVMEQGLQPSGNNVVLINAERETV